MSRPLARALARSAVVLGLLLLVSRADAQRPKADPAARAAEGHDLVLECRGALWKLTFDEATAAGLNPVATPVSFDGAKARTARGDGTLTVAGTEEYRPTYRAPAFPVRYECVVDLATKAVRSARYAAVDASGAGVARPPVELVRDAIVLSACRDAIAGEVRDEARARRG